MANKTKNHFLSRSLINIAIFIFSLFREIPSFISLIELEANAAAKSLSSLLVMYLIAGSLLTSTWLCILAMIFMYLVSLHLSFLLSIFIIIVINILLIILTTLAVKRSKSKVSFAKSRQILRKMGNQ